MRPRIVSRASANFHQRRDGRKSVADSLLEHGLRLHQIVPAAEIENGMTRVSSAVMPFLNAEMLGFLTAAADLRVHHVRRLR